MVVTNKLNSDVRCQADANNIEYRVFSRGPGRKHKREEHSECRPDASRHPGQKLNIVLQEALVLFGALVTLHDASPFTHTETKINKRGK